MRNKVLAILLLMLVAMPLGATAQDEPVVYGVLFHSHTCPHCVEFIENDLPEYEAEFGDQFQLLKIETSGGQGQDLIRAAIRQFNIPRDRQAVPMMILGDTVLVGGEINTQARTIIREALAEDGLAYPDIPGLDPANVEVDSGFSTDDLANVFAVIILFGLLATIAITGMVIYQTRALDNKRVVNWFEQLEGRVVLLGIVLVGAALAVSLVFHSADDLFAVSMAVLALVGLSLASGAIGNQLMNDPDQKKSKRKRRRKPKINLPEWVVPLIILSGLVVAIYLSYVEVGNEEAACGLVGDCNAVQASKYAELFGVIPIGVMGIVGYLVLLACWGASQLKETPLATLGKAGFFGASLFGVIFSAYLTFLEPFVIKATCTWCLTSAVVMMALLWHSIPTGWPATERLLLSMSNKKTQPTAG